MSEESTQIHFNTRDYRPDNAPQLAEICRQAILETGSSIYSQTQCTAWASLTQNAETWATRLQAAWVRVAYTDNDELVGFGGILVPGHIDLLFTAPSYNRQGVASLIIADLLDLAAAMGAQRVTVDASELALRLFEKHGFSRNETFEHECGNERLRGYHLVRG